MGKDRLLPKRIIEYYLEKYEQEELTLNDKSGYYMEKDKLLSKRWIKASKVNEVIKKYSLYPYSGFCINLPARIATDIRRDIKFSDCLYIQIPCFSGETNKKIEKEVSERKFKNLILDLRMCVGGNLEDCVRSCNIFLEECEIVSVRSKAMKVTYYADKGKIDFKKVFVLVDAGTMSCAEIMAFSMANNLDNVQILGGETYGKDVVVKNYINRKYGCKLSVTAFYWQVNSMSVELLPDFIKICDKKEIWEHIYKEIGN